VRYAETDQMGVVYHSNFFVWFEIGRVELFRELGVAYKGHGTERPIATSLSAIAIADSSAPRVTDDLLRVRTRIAEAGNRTIKSPTIS